MAPVIQSIELAFWEQRRSRRATRAAAGNGDRFRCNTQTFPFNRAALIQASQIPRTRAIRVAFIKLDLDGYPRVRVAWLAGIFGVMRQVACARLAALPIG